MTLKYLTPDNLYQQIESFTQGMAVSKEAFELIVPNCTLEDFEWNHMDQMHRPWIHRTYEKGVRIASGTHFALSLTQWKKWPLFITVTDVYVAKGLFYQSLTLAGMVFLHSIISMEPLNDNSVKLRDEWFIASHKWLRFLHKFLHKKLHQLNARLQQEDEPLRQGRFALRKKGFRFHTDTPNYYNSNRLTLNTIYPPAAAGSTLSVTHLTEQPSVQTVGNLSFILQKENQDTYAVWPATCPHEGGPLAQGSFCEGQLACPWHGLRFSPVRLSAASPQGSRYGFEYKLHGDKIEVHSLACASQPVEVPTESECLIDV